MWDSTPLFVRIETGLYTTVNDLGRAKDGSRISAFFNH
jgi:hypothetical protein